MVVRGGRWRPRPAGAGSGSAGGPGPPPSGCRGRWRACGAVALLHGGAGGASDRGDPAPVPARPGAHDLPPVEVRRSARRRRTVTAFRDGGTVVVCIPADFTRAQERVWVDRMVTKLAAQDQRRVPATTRSHAAPPSSAPATSAGGRGPPACGGWPTRPPGGAPPHHADGTIRLSDRLQGMPSWVVDYVLVHELAHLLEHGHGDRFWELVDAYPRTERARGYLEGFATARDLPIADVDDGADPAAQMPADRLHPRCEGGAWHPTAQPPPATPTSSTSKRSAPRRPPPAAGWRSGATT